MPTCALFDWAFNSRGLADINEEVNGELHGQVHIMAGGHWDFTGALPSAALAAGAQSALLSSKFLWRQGVVRCPGYCSADKPGHECACGCPAGLLAQLFGANYTARDVLRRTGLTAFDGKFLADWANATDAAQASSLPAAVADADTRGHAGDGAWAPVLEMLCRVGHAGEMFTSAAPYDPLFWSLHGTAERFLGYKRLAAERGQTQLREAGGTRTAT